jgi:hypothetical protein
VSRDNLLSEIFGGYPTHDHLAVLAQYIVNNSGELPSHITTAPFWNEYREKLLSAARGAPEIRRQFTASSAIGAQLLKTSDAVSNELQAIRLKLSIVYDVPYVEPSSVESEREWYA